MDTPDWSQHMKVVRQPTVWLSSIPLFLPHPDYVLPADPTDATGVVLEPSTDVERLIAHAAKVCYDSFGPDGRPVVANVRNLLKEGHGSVLEHANVSLTISGISRGLSHELVRHRSGMAYSQRSTRYTEEGGAAIVLDPYYAHLHDDDPLLRAFLVSCEDSLIEYRDAVAALLIRAPQHLEKTARRKWARGKARQLLPHALETRLVATGNLRAWRNIIEQRMSPGAEAEIARLGAAILDTLRPLAPIVFEDMVVLAKDNVPLVSTVYRKV
jgi:thymidylate synthase (FAD)